VTEFQTAATTHPEFAVVESEVVIKQ